MSEQQNMASNLREKERIDYKVLNESGQIQLKSSNLDIIQSTQPTNMENIETTDKYSLPSDTINSDEMSNQMKELKLTKTTDNTIQSGNKTKQQEINVISDLDLLKSKYDILKDEIEDYIDENPTNYSIVSIDDIDSCVQKITDLRSQLRQIVKQIQIAMDTEQFKSAFMNEITSIYGCIKEYIINAKDRKAEIRMQNKEVNDANSTIKLKRDIEENSQRKRATEFLINEVNRISNELLEEFEKRCDGQITDDEISRRKEDLPANLLKMEQLSAKFQKCLETIPDDYEDKETYINLMSTQYNNLVQYKETYEKFVQNEIREREISKEKSFQMTSQH